MIRLPLDPGRSGWQAILPPRKVTASLQNAISTDYLIIGAGFAGLSAARRLLQLDSSAAVTVLEGREVAGGPAGRNSGFMIDLPHDLSSEDYAGSAENDRRQTAMNRHAITFARDAVTEYEIASEAMHDCGKINAAATAKGLRHNQDYAAHLDHLGESYEMLNSAQMRALTGIDYYLGGLKTPGASVLQPALYIRGLADGVSRRQSLKLYENSAVIKLENLQQGWLAHTASGSVTAARVILAVNGLVQEFGYFKQRLMPVFTYASMTRALSGKEVQALGGQANWALTPADPMGSTVRRISGTGGERIVIRNQFTYDPSLEIPTARMRKIVLRHQQAFTARFPMLANVAMEYCWGGRLCLSKNNVFAHGEVAPGVFSACCQNGLGVARGTISGIIAAEQAANASQSIIPEYQKEAEPERLWPQPIMQVGANLYLYWKERRAGKEF